MSVALKKIDQNVIKLIEQKLEEAKPLLDGNYGPEDTHKRLIWIASLRFIIDSLDPFGTDSTNSLQSDYHRLSREEGGSLSESTRIWNSCAELYGIFQSLKSGIVKITEQKESLFISKCAFYKRDLPPQENLVFTLMPFTETWSDNVWRKHIKDVVEGMKEVNLICKRADDLFGQDVMQDIFESILTSRIVIAEITNRNANVFYELGIAHSLGKDVILFSQGQEHIPFDLNRFRHCIYSYNAVGVTRMQNFLRDSIKDILQLD